ncbi:MAG: transglutaminase-like domain-containing protein [Candidatus Hydrogenedentales bacterium]
MRVSMLGASRTLVLAVVAISLFWIVMLVLLLRREVFLPRLAALSLANPAYSSESTNTSMGIFLDERMVGTVNVRTNPNTRDGKEGITVGLFSRMRLDMLGEDNELVVRGNAWFARAGGLSDFDFELVSGDHETSVSAVISDGFLDAKVNSGGEEFPVKWPIKDDLVLWNNMGTSTLNVPAMEKGQEYFVDTFDPMTMSVTHARMTYVGDESLDIEGTSVTTRVVTTSISGIESKAWISDRGEVMKAETPLGFTLKRISTREAATGLDAGDESNSLLRRVAIVPTGRRPIRGARRMIACLDGVPKEATVPTDETQQPHTDGCFVIESPSSEEGLDSPGVSFESMDAYLAADPFVQSTHPRIVEQAKSIVGGEVRPWQRAKRINDWVFEHIEKKAVLSLPSALDVLATGEGDCNEHTVLFAALARASGVPARIAIGVVWSDEYNGFYYHAWPEVYVGRWVWMDPTFGQSFADATHIKLLNGGIEKWWQVAQFLGKLQIDVATVE